MQPATQNGWALITGASTGIGRELAGCFAADGWRLVVVARSQGALEQLALELTARHGTEVRVLAQDLNAPGAAEAIFRATADLHISALVNNAGFGAFGPFAQADLERQTAMMQVNLVALMQLTHRFVQPMLARRQGRILNVASTAAFQPGPLNNVYYAGKAFVYSFSYALADELDGTGVTVTTLCPGATRTEFFTRAGIRMKGGWPMMDAAKVARLGYRGMLRGKRVVIAGGFNWMLSFISKRAPVRLTSAIARRLHQSVAR